MVDLPEMQETRADNMKVTHNYILFIPSQFYWTAKYRQQEIFLLHVLIGFNVSGYIHGL